MTSPLLMHYPQMDMGSKKKRNIQILAGAMCGFEFPIASILPRLYFALAPVSNSCHPSLQIHPKWFHSNRIERIEYIYTEILLKHHSQFLQHSLHVARDTHARAHTYRITHLFIQI